MVRAKFSARTALALALALGVATGGFSAPAMAKEKKPEAPKIQPSKAFIPVYVAANKAIEEAAKRQDVIAARAAVSEAETAYRSAQGKKARDEARARYDAAVTALGALFTAEKEAVEKAFAAATIADDNFFAGKLALELGQLSHDKKLQRRGLQAMVDSGKMAAAENAKFNYYIGGLAYDLRDYAGARTALQAAIAGGYTEGDPEGLLADAYFNDNQPMEGLKVLDAAATAKGASASEDMLRKGVINGYKAKSTEYAVSFSVRLVQNFPTQDNWALAIAVVRDMNKFQNQEQIDLMRLMDRTKSWSESRDFIEYIQAADPRRLPGEVLKIVNLGLASGKLEASDPFVADAKSISSGRIAADKASLAGLESDARAANASAATAMAAGDAYLSYESFAKAEEMYKIALTKPGVDSPRVLTRLGIAQTDQGKYAEAQETFAKVTGLRAPIAQLWAAYAKSKATPTP